MIGESWWVPFKCQSNKIFNLNENFYFKQKLNNSFFCVANVVVVNSMIKYYEDVQKTILLLDQLCSIALFVNHLLTHNWMLIICFCTDTWEV